MSTTFNVPNGGPGDGWPASIENETYNHDLGEANAPKAVVEGVNHLLARHHPSIPGSAGVLRLSTNPLNRTELELNLMLSLQPYTLDFALVVQYSTGNLAADLRVEMVVDGEDPIIENGGPTPGPGPDSSDRVVLAYRPGAESGDEIPAVVTFTARRKIESEAHTDVYIWAWLIEVADATQITETFT